MKFLKSIIVVLCILYSNIAFAGNHCITNDSWSGPDKVKHALVGSVTGAAGTLIFKDTKYGLISTVAIAGAKELYDLKTGRTCSLQDFAVTVIAGAVSSYTTNWFIKIDPVNKVASVTYSRNF
jgi:uncharacterized protein YfiM (DUF2279 family)